MAERGPVHTRPYIPEPLPYAHHGLRFWDLWLGSRPVCPSPVPSICSLPGRFLRDYDTLFPVADDVSLLQQASAVLYPTTATRQDLAWTGWSWLLGPRGSEGGLSPEYSGQPVFPRGPPKPQPLFLEEMTTRILGAGWGSVLHSLGVY